eukprot:CAMPEP_0180386566 /NCGR_PEP_ID=MMETSP0989-20121125/29723_1 /TAXON_ID=697907 /ORGANISM="non described non described, Strain CCMP2293" /LENGTH=140 /DNA_ID=CAMNT_0022387269 /DNA_START=131 /DNA_END=551 /DNA_ORIENTATION=+
MRGCQKRIQTGVRSQIRTAYVRQTTPRMSCREGLSHKNRNTIPRRCTPQRGNSQTQTHPSSPSRAALLQDTPLAVLVTCAPGNVVPETGVLVRDQDKCPLAHPHRRCARRATGMGADAAQPRQVVLEEVPRPARAAPALL